VQAKDWKKANAGRKKGASKTWHGVDATRVTRVPPRSRLASRRDEYWTGSLCVISLTRSTGTLSCLAET